VSANLGNDRIASKYRTAELSTVSIIFSLGAHHDTMSAVALVGHNLSSSATVTFSFNATDSWPGATTQTVAFNSGVMLTYFTSFTPEYFTTETPDYLVAETGEHLVTSYDYPYAKVTISDPTNADAYVEVGKVWISQSVSVSPSSLLDYTVELKSGDVVYHGRGRQKYGITRDPWRRFELSFPESGYDMIEQIEAMHDDVGNWSPIIFANFDSLRGYSLVEPCYCTIDGDVSFRHSDKMKFAYALAMEEEL
jgi:hypothetical protein